MMAASMGCTDTAGCQGRCEISVPAISPGGTPTGPIAIPATSATGRIAIATAIAPAVRRPFAAVLVVRVLGLAGLARPAPATSAVFTGPFLAALDRGEHGLEQVHHARAPARGD